MDKKRKVREMPRLSINQLAEYLEVHSSRRKRILMEAKFPPLVPSIYYDDVKKALKAYYAKGMDDTVLIKAIDKFKNKDVEPGSQEQHRDTCMRLLDLVLKESASPLASYKLLPYAKTNHLINIAGVDISVCPDLLIEKKTRNVVKAGAVKFNFSKNKEMSIKGQNVVSEMLYQYVQQFLLSNGELANKKYCFSFDVYKQKLGSCPSSSVRLYKEIEEACEEIAGRWDKLKQDVLS